LRTIDVKQLLMMSGLWLTKGSVNTALERVWDFILSKKISQNTQSRRAWAGPPKNPAGGA